MKLFISLAVVCFGASSVYGLEGGFRVRWGFDNFETEHFIGLPKTSSEALSEGWMFERRGDADVLRFLVLWCHPTKVLCVLYDDTGYAAGLQVAVPADEFTQSAYDLSRQGFIQWTPSDGRTYWAIQQYYINDNLLAIPAADRIASRDPNKFLQFNSIWVRGHGREILRIGNTVDQIYAAGFTKQACMTFMGDHQYMNMSSSTPCTTEAMYPFFTLTYEDELIGTGLGLFGSFPEKDGEFFERASRAVVQMIVPEAPECMYDLATTPGLITIHMYYIDKPWTVLCD